MIWSIIIVLIFIGIGTYSVIVDVLDLNHRKNQSDCKEEKRGFIIIQIYRLFWLIFFLIIVFIAKGSLNERHLLVFIIWYLLISLTLEVYGSKRKKTRIIYSLKQVFLKRWMPLCAMIVFLYLVQELQNTLSYLVLFLGLIVFFWIIYLIIFKWLIYRIFEHIPYINPFDQRLDSIDASLKNEIYLIRSKKISLPINAVLSGLIKKRVWMSKSLLYTLKSNQIQAIIAHELGHHKNGHLLKRLMVLIVVLVGYFGILFVVFKTDLVINMALSNNFLSRLSVVLILTYCFDQVGQWAFYNWAQKQEYQADLYVSNLGFKEDLIQALTVLDRFINEPSFHPLYAKIKISHPPTKERIKRLEAIDKIETFPLT